MHTTIKVSEELKAELEKLKTLLGKESYEAVIWELLKIYKQLEKAEEIARKLDKLEKILLRIEAALSEDTNIYTATEQFK